MMMRWHIKTKLTEHIEIPVFLSALFFVQVSTHFLSFFLSFDDNWTIEKNKSNRMVLVFCFSSSNVNIDYEIEDQLIDKLLFFLTFKNKWTVQRFYKCKSIKCESNDERKKRTFHALLKILVEDFKNHSFEITLRYYTYKYSFETDLHSMFDNNFFSLSLS